MRRFDILHTVLLSPFVATGKNIVPPAFNSHKRFEDRIPIVQMRGPVSHERNDPNSIAPSHIFYQNYKETFSWSDSRLQAILGIDTQEVGSSDAIRNFFKRSPGSNQNGVIQQPSCLGCIEAANGVVKTLADLTTEWLEKQMLVKDPMLLQDTCLFYTSVVGASEEQARKTLPKPNMPGLSYPATQYACSHGMYSIWTLFPGENNVVDASFDDPKARNFYEVFVPGSWLNFLEADVADVRIYFRNMSRAMARQCGGIIYVMTFGPDRLWSYGFIWGETEYIALKGRWSSGGAGSPTLLIAIDAMDVTNQISIDWNDRRPLRRVKRSDPEYLDLEEFDLHKRDTCANNVEYELGHGDWFG